jgi:hypothetical protein
MTVLAEGIETQEQLERLRHLGCELDQGYLFSPVVPTGEVPAMLDREPGSWEKRLALTTPPTLLLLGMGRERFGHSDAAHRDPLGSRSPLGPGAVSSERSCRSSGL